MLCSARQEMALLQMSKDHDRIITVGTLKGAHNKREGKDVKDGGVRAEDSHWSSFYRHGQHEKGYHHHKSQTDGDYMYTKRKDEYSRFDSYDGLALSDAFLGNYYSQVSMSLTPLKKLNINGALSLKGS